MRHVPDESPSHCTKCASVAVMLQEMRGSLPKEIAVPASVALPFGTFERVLTDKANSEAAAAVKAAQKELVGPATCRANLRSLLRNLCYSPASPSRSTDGRTLCASSFKSVKMSHQIMFQSA